MSEGGGNDNVPLTKSKQPKAQIGERPSKSSAIKGPFQLGVGMDMAASTLLLTMVLLMHHGGGVAFTAAASIVTRMIPHLPAIDPAFGNLIPVGDDFSDEEIHALARQRSDSASQLAYSAFTDQYAFVIGCQIGDDCVKMLEGVENVPSLVIWPSNYSLHYNLFSNITLNVASRVRLKLS